MFSINLAAVIIVQIGRGSTTKLGRHRGKKCIVNGETS